MAFDSQIEFESTPGRITINRFKANRFNAAWFGSPWIRTNPARPRSSAIEYLPPPVTVQTFVIKGMVDIRPQIVDKAMGCNL